MSQDSSGLRIQSRDIAILYELTTMHAVTMHHIACLYFDKKYAAAYKRIARLRNAGLIELRPGELGGQSALLQITRSGYKVICSYASTTVPWATIQRRHQRNRDAFLKHDLGIMDFKAVIIPALAEYPDRRVETFTTKAAHLVAHKQTRDHGLGGRGLRPDAYTRIADGDQWAHLFIEIDRGTEPQRTVQQKAIVYRHRYRTGAFARSMHGTPSAPESAPFRVLFVCSSEERRDNLANCLLDIVPPVLTQCWFATKKDVLSDPLGAIWLTPYALRVARKTKTMSAELTPLFSEGKEKLLL